MAENKSKEELQQRYMEYQMLDAQAKQLQQQVAQVEKGMSDLMETKQNLDELQRSKDGIEVIIPVSNGIFTKAKMGQNKELLVNVGAGVVVNKSFDDAKELLDNQLKELTAYRQQLMQNLQMLAGKATEIALELKSLAE